MGIKSAIRSVVRPPLVRSALDRRATLIVLLYHWVEPDPPRFLSGAGVTTHPDAFDDHLRYVRARYEVVSLWEGVRRARAGALTRTCVAVTFDDGPGTFGEYSLPILEKHGVPCTVFVNRAFLKGGRHWLFEVAWLEQEGRRELLEEIFGPCPGPSYVRYLRREAEAEVLARRRHLGSVGDDLAAMPGLHFDRGYLEECQANPLIEVGNHSVDHPRFSRLDRARQRRQIEDNHEALADLSNYRRLFAVPFGTSGDWNLDTVACTAAAGHEFVSASGGVNFGGGMGVDIRRVPCDGVGIGQLEERLISVGMGVP
ncbi:MAG TPA: polysaccharide deacetylase family protein [Phycisphaerae bacterium]|nr:polysaccharide deacetylase family protein [Phycisphaerae bacterium]